MAFTINSGTMVFTNTSDSTGLALNSGDATLEFPTTNSSGASVGIPQVMAVTSDGGPFTWHALGGGGSGSGFDALETYIISTQTTATSYLVSEMAPSLTGPISCRVTMVGSGAGGGGVPAAGSSINNTGGGGGGGATAIKVFNGLLPTSAFTVTVPAGGAGGAAGANTGSPGAPTLVTYGSSVYGANGGSAGVFFNCGGAGGAATQPSGANADPDIYILGGIGGAGASITGNLAPSQGGSTTQSGAVGILSNAASANGISPTVGGAGGSGGYSSSSGTTASGGNGAPGMVIFEFFGIQD